MIYEHEGVTFSVIEQVMHNFTFNARIVDNTVVSDLVHLTRENFISPRCFNEFVQKIKQRERDNGRKDIQ